MDHPAIGAVQISSGSMRPTLEIGDTVLFHRRFVRVEPGDIVVFRTFVHRAVWVDRREVVWEIGDANAQWPKPRPYTLVEGIGFMRVRGNDWTPLRTDPLARLIARAGRAGARQLWGALRGRLGLNG